MVKKRLGLDQNSGLILVTTAWNLSKKHWWDLMNFESILFSYSLIVWLSKISSLPLQMESWAQCLGGCIFSYSRGNCLFLFQFPFWYFGKVWIWPMYHSFETRIWFLIIFLLLKESHTLFQIWVFCYTFNYFVVQFGVIENTFTKINIKIIPVVLVDEFYIHMHHPIKSWLFEKIMLELVYLCIFL